MLIGCVMARGVVGRPLNDTVNSLLPQVDRLLCVSKDGAIPASLSSEKLLAVAEGSDLLKTFRPHANDMCILLEAGFVYSFSFIRRVRLLYENIDLSRKIVGLEGIIYSDFFDGSLESCAVFKSDEDLREDRLVNQLGLTGLFFRGNDIFGFAPIELFPKALSLDIAIQAHRNAVPLIAVARGKNWIFRHTANFAKTAVSTDSNSLNRIAEIAGLGRLAFDLLDPRGEIPHKIMRREGSFLLNETFEKLKQSLDERLQFDEGFIEIAPGWSIGISDERDAFAISICARDDGQGICLSFDGLQESIRLFASIGTPTARSSNLHFGIRFRATGAEALSPSIDGVFVVTVRPKKRPVVLCRIAGAIFNGGVIESYSTRFSLPQIDPRDEAFLCVQFNRHVGLVEIEHMKVQDSPIKGATDIRLPLRTSSASANEGPDSSSNINISEVTNTGGLRPFRSSIGKPASAGRFSLLNPKSVDRELVQQKLHMPIYCSSLGHNALGRAHTLGEIARNFCHVSILGTFSSRHDEHIWPPLKNAEIPIWGAPANDISELLQLAKVTVGEGKQDYVCVSKPRFSGFLLGLAHSIRHDCPLILDIDDLELSFLRNQTPLHIGELRAALQNDISELRDPSGEIWTRFCESFVEDVDAITVSSEPLLRRYGGKIIRHARDENQFFPDEVKRSRIRKEMGIGSTQKMILFLGTPRGHKGISRIAEKVTSRVGSELVLCLVGLDEALLSQGPLARLKSPSVKLFGIQPYERLADIVRCADAISVLQDSDSGVTEFQVPAKLADGLAMGLPALVTRTAPFSDLIDAGVVVPADTDDELEVALNGILDGSLNTRSKREKRLAYFRNEFGILENGKRLRDVLEQASSIFPRKKSIRLRKAKELNSLFARKFGMGFLDKRLW